MAYLWSQAPHFVYLLKKCWFFQFLYIFFRISRSHGSWVHIWLFASCDLQLFSLCAFNYTFRWFLFFYGKLKNKNWWENIFSFYKLNNDQIKNCSVKQRIKILVKTFPSNPNLTNWFIPLTRVARKSDIYAYLTISSTDWHINSHRNHEAFFSAI